jgi:hypothetical protein
VGELDGDWNLKRLSGVLPPLSGLHKRIRGDRGETVLPGGLALPFRVVDRQLRYRAPLSPLVDLLEPEGDGWRGRTTLFGRTVGEFRMSRPAQPRPPRRV